MSLNIGVCIKVSPNPDKYDQMEIDPETKTLKRMNIDSVISGTDLHAIEEALRLKEKFGGRISIISMGPPSAEKQIREALGYGCDEAFLLSDRKLGGADALATSYSLAKCVEKVGGFDILLLGNASDDGATAHVPSQVGEFLKLPHITDVISFEAVSESIIKVKKETEKSVNTYEVKLPAVVGVSKRLNTVRHPNVMAIFSAKNKPLSTITADDLIDLDESRIGLNGSPTVVTGFIDVDYGRECTVIKGSNTEKATEVARIISKYIKS